MELLTTAGKEVVDVTIAVEDEETKMDDDQNGRRPKWKTIKMEDNQNGKRPKWKMT